MKTTSKFSLLYPATFEGEPAKYTWGDNTVIDLDLDQIAVAANMGPQYRETIKSMLLNLSADAQVIDYRQQVLADFLDSNGIATGFEELLPALARLRNSLTIPAHTGEASLPGTLGRLNELNSYVACVTKLQSILDAAGPRLRAQGLCNLRDRLKEITTEESFQSLEKNLPGLLARLRGIPSITIGINLDNELKPVEATLLSVNDKPFKGGSLLQQLMGTKLSDKPDQGIAQLHSLPFVEVTQPTRYVRTPGRVDPMMVPLFRDLLKLIQHVINPISAALKQYAKVNAHFLVTIEEEVAFYLGAVKLIRKMQAVGLPMCRPVILPMQERVCEMQGVYNLRLALDMQNEKPDLRGVIIQNDVNFGPQGRIFILTGPNQGGKTVYTQAVGIAQVLFQAGLYVPAETARISPADGLYTHFAIEEKSIQGMGRLSEESQRLSEIFQSVTQYGMVLLNESLSSTSSGESLYLAQDVVRALRLFGVRAIFATHLHELAEGVDAINREISGDSLVVSLVAEVDSQARESNDLVPRTYKIKPGPPKGHSYAKGIALRYGISFEQLAGQWQERREPGMEKSTP
jgi:hypothetical protein